MPLVELIGNGLKTSPEQIGAMATNKGVIFGFTVIVIVAVLAHWPASGVKVYVVVLALSNAGAQVPVIPLIEVKAKGLNVAPEQIGLIGLKLGVTIGFTFIVSVATEAH
jgi:hypothetical protein